MLKLISKINKPFLFYNRKRNYLADERLCQLLYPIELKKEIKQFFSNYTIIERECNFCGKLCIQTPQGYSFFLKKESCQAISCIECSPIHSLVKTFLYMPDNDGKEYSIDSRCAICKSQLNLAKDYLLAIEHGGTDKIDNKITLCLSCRTNKKNNPFSILYLTRNIHYISKRYHNDSIYYPYFQKTDCMLQKNVNDFIFHHISSDESILRENIRIYSKKHAIPIDAHRMTLILHHIKDIWIKE